MCIVHSTLRDASSPYTERCAQLRKNEKTNWICWVLEKICGKNYWCLEKMRITFCLIHSNPPQKSWILLPSAPLRYEIKLANTIGGTFAKPLKPTHKLSFAKDPDIVGLSNKWIQNESLQSNYNIIFQYLFCLCSARI